MLDAETLLIHLRRHRGKANGITAAKLCNEINKSNWQKAFGSGTGAGPDTNTRELRKAVEQLRSEGFHVCAHPRDGYYLAETEEELEETIEYLQKRAMRSLKQIARMRQVSVPDLLGQMRFTTW